ncbi:MAG: tRNA pseudouridine(55) synthase TruB [Lachnospiraceae bacterium]|nr:tRNA pseudouridine(55) synthase TruB [Lachnospiraceae bacterium]
MLNGIINVYKESGYTSHDVVAKMRGICGQKKIGHTGTLDPEAIGVLPVCLGSGTKLCDMLADRDKEYEAWLLLGVTTDTQDTTGQILEKKEVNCTEDEVREAILSFQGEYMQVPPMYSALKVNGKKLYELARAGKEVERQARPVTIHEIEILEMELPRVLIRVVCSKGTYIRTLCDDIGKKLGCGGAMQLLKRTRVGEFAIDRALTLRDLQALKLRGEVEGVVRSVDECFAQYPSLHVVQEHQKLIDNGNSFYPDQTVEKKKYKEGQWVRVYNEEERFYGIFAWENSRHWYKPVKMFL